MEFLLQILKHTPVWVWLLLGTLVYYGYVQSRTRRVSKARLLLLPAALAGLSLYGVWSAFGASVVAFCALLLGIALAVLANRILKQPGGVTYSESAGTFTIPGSWLPLALIMIIFFVRYAVAVTLVVKPWLRSLGAFAGIVGLVYGLLGGIFLARTLYTLRGK